MAVAVAVAVSDPADPAAVARIPATALHRPCPAGTCKLGPWLGVRGWREGDGGRREGTWGWGWGGENESTDVVHHGVEPSGRQIGVGHVA